MEDFLPPPMVPQITIDKISHDTQKLLHEIVRQVYVINRDDFNTREIAMVEQEKRGKFFDDLRKNYPVRREFQNTKIIMTSGNALKAKLSGIGFQIK